MKSDNEHFWIQNGYVEIIKRLISANPFPDICMVNFVHCFERTFLERTNKNAPNRGILSSKLFCTCTFIILVSSSFYFRDLNPNTEATLYLSIVQGRKEIIIA